MKYRKLGNKKSQMSAIGLDVGFVLFSSLGKRVIMKKYILGIWMVCLASLGMAQTPKAEQVMNKKQQYIVEVAALVGKGDLAKLKPVLVAGLEDGMTVNELKEVMVHSYAYGGFPRALRGLQTFVAVLDERKANGIEDKRGREASPITDTRRQVRARTGYPFQNFGCAG